MMQSKVKRCIVLKTFLIASMLNVLFVMPIQSQVLENPIVPVADLQFSNSGQSIVPDSIQALKNSSIVELLKGQIAGLKVSKADGAPGAAFDIAVRGLNSLRGDNQPLIVVDGVMLNPTNLEVMNPWRNLDGLDFQSNQNALWGLNSENIAQIEVLKDASTTALYGSRGANGVILIKTKNGNKKSMELKWSSNVALSTLAKRIDFLSPNQYIDYRNKLSSPSLDITGLLTADWQKEAFKNSISTNHNISLSGTQRSTSFYLSLFYGNEEGIVKGTSANNFGMQLNLDQKLNDKIQFGSKIIFTNNVVSMTQSNSYLGASGIINQLGAAPYAGIGENAASWLNGYNDDANAYRAMPNMYMKVQLSPSWSLMMNSGVDFMKKNRLRWMGPEIDRGKINNSRAGLSELSAMHYNEDATVSFKPISNSIHLLQFDLTGGYFGYENIGTTTQSYDFFSTALRGNGINFGSKMVGPVYDKNTSSTVYGTFNAQYKYLDKYEIKAGVRSDKLLNYDDQPSYFPFVQAKWDLAKEAFAKNLNLNNFFLKGGYGMSGTNTIDAYTDSSKYFLSQPALSIPFFKSLSYHLRLQTIKKEWNVGFESSMFNNRLTLGLVYYNGNVVDELSAYNFSSPQKIINADSTLSYVTPVKQFWQNKMTLQNQGIETTISLLLLNSKNIKWDIGGNVAFNRNQVTDVGGNTLLGATNEYGIKGGSVGVLGGKNLYATAFINKSAPGVFYGYRTQGVLSVENSVTAPTLNGVKLMDGDVNYTDINPDGVIDEKDKVVIGSPNPDFIFGFNTALTVYRWTVKAMFDGMVGNDVLNLNRLYSENVNGLNNISISAYNNAWESGSTENKSPKIGSTSLNEISDRLVEDGSFIRLSTITVVYDLPIKNNKVISSLNINALVSNLFTLTSYSGYNPNVNSFSGNWSMSGIDSGAYPNARSISLGIMAKF